MNDKITDIWGVYHDATAAGIKNPVIVIIHPRNPVGRMIAERHIIRLLGACRAKLLDPSTGRLTTVEPLPLDVSGAEEIQAWPLQILISTLTEIGILRTTIETLRLQLTQPTTFFWMMHIGVDRILVAPMDRKANP